MGLSIQLIKKHFSWPRQALESLMEDYAPYHTWLLSLVGEQYAEKLRDDYCKLVQARLEKLPQVLEAYVELVKLEGGLSIFPYLCNTHDTRDLADPINLLFWNYGGHVNIQSALSNCIGGWVPTHGVALYALIDDSDHNGSIGWKKFDCQLREGSFFSTSTHIRIYEGFRQCTHGKRVYSIAAVHRENFWPRPHTVIDWDASQNDVETGFRGLASLSGAVQQVDLQNAGTFQNVTNDGIASYIEVKRPPWFAIV